MFAARSSLHTNKFFRGQVVPLWSVNHDHISQVVAFISYCVLSSVFLLLHSSYHHILSPFKK
jgi:hypothetical protein